MAKCSFCGKKIEQGTGKMYVKKDGKIFWFCSNKCEKHTFKLRHKPANTEWTEYHRETKK
ncbi:50S ribosomal protein L24e [Candidatus Woesearchaeota archaeon]|nr:50S ribosomal protein L24e [Candidatus Woesearchaeota archaeon]MBW3021422.1 50S ribosomal protein L24e [Candidatus Woesearchaeota archaeon]